MKACGFHLCWPLVLVGVLVTSCSQPGRSQPSELESPRPTATSPSLNAEELKESASTAVSSEAYLSGNIKVISVDRREKNVRLAYDLDISFPQIEKPRTSNQRKFNRYVQRLIKTDIKTFRRYCAKNNKHRDGTKRRIEYHLGMAYKPLFATPETLSIDLTIESFTGYLNSDWFPIPINYNLKSGKPLALADIFQRRSKFLEVISTYCMEEFVQRGLNCGGEGVSNEQWMRDGAKPNANNYEGWNLTRNGLQITFGEYQVGPGCLGLVKVMVPYGHLQRILRRDVKWFPFKH